MNNDLLAKKSYENAMKCIQISGTQDEIHQMEELLHLISLAPIGREILKGISEQERVMPLFFSSNPADFGPPEYDFSLSGCYSWYDNSVKLLKNVSDSSKSAKEKSICSKIKEACVLGHEMQHCADSHKNRWLNVHASCVDENVLITVLGEVHASLSDDQLDRELRALYGMLGKKIVRGKEIMESAEPIPREKRTEVLRRVLSGKVPMFKRYMNGMRRVVAKQKYTGNDFRTAVAFHRNVEYYLKEMLQVDMSFDEAMLHIRQSLKLLPMPKDKSVESNR